MAVLRKGSKGPEVKKAQELLNKAGTKSKLVVDGDFGNLTDKQLRIFQDKCDVKPDGKIGDDTWAVLRYGKALPVLPEIDTRVTSDATHGSYAPTLQKLVKGAEKEFLALVKSGTKAFGELDKLLAEEVSIGAQRASIAKKIAAKRAEFEKTVSKNPAKAEKMAKDFDKLKDHWYKLNIAGSNWRSILDKEIVNMTKCLKTLKDV